MVNVKTVKKRCLIKHCVNKNRRHIKRQAKDGIFLISLLFSHAALHVPYSCSITAKGCIMRKSGSSFGSSQVCEIVGCSSYLYSQGVEYGVLQGSWLLPCLPQHYVQSKQWLNQSKAIRKCNASKLDVLRRKGQVNKTNL